MEGLSPWGQDWDRVGQRQADDARSAETKVMADVKGMNKVCRFIGYVSVYSIMYHKGMERPYDRTEMRIFSRTR